LELENAVRTTELRKQENDIYDRIIELSNEYSIKRDAYLTSVAGNEKSTLQNKMRELKLRLDTAKDDFTAIESKLSLLEGRTRRKIELEFIVPAAPQNFGVSVH
jgi:hypothetical protein